jgi:hypothetical protein
VLIVSALLEGTGGGVAAPAAPNETAEDAEDAGNLEDSQRASRFDDALSFLAANAGSNGMQSSGGDAGSRMAVEIQRAITRQAAAMIGRGEVLLAGAFRMSIIREPAEAALFAGPLTARRLALCVAADLRERGRTPLPFVLMINNARKGTYLVVGVPCGSTVGHVPRNFFAATFRGVAAASNSAMRQDGFDPAIVEVAADDIGGFMEQLHVVSSGGDGDSDSDL